MSHSEKYLRYDFLDAVAALLGNWIADSTTLNQFIQSRWVCYCLGWHCI